jgi:riboflavin biosynthesis pyrimidine reductase
MTRHTQFQRFVDRKTAEASSAALQPFVTDVDHGAERLEPVGNHWSRRYFGGAFYVSPPPSPDRPACSLVFVESSDGNTGASDPSTLGGGATDKHVIYEGLSQVAADAVLSGSGTIDGAHMIFAVWHPELVRLRAELGKPRYPIQIVGTLRGVDLTDSLLFNVPEIQVLIVTVGDGARRMREDLRSRPWVRPVVMAKPEHLPRAFRLLRTFGIARISGVGGRHMATALVDAGLVQDVYLTTSPRPGGEPGTPMYPRPLTGGVVVRSHGTGTDAGVRFRHIHLDRPSQTEPDLTAKGAASA